MLNVQGEKTLIQEVIRNLVDNAVKHGGGNLKIDVNVEQSEDRGMVTIRDNGVGMRSALQQIDSAPLSTIKKEDSGHAGIGLTVVREILNLLSGRIEISNGLEGRGTIAHVSFKTAEK